MPVPSSGPHGPPGRHSAMTKTMTSSSSQYSPTLRDSNRWRKLAAELKPKSAVYIAGLGLDYDTTENLSAEELDKLDIVVDTIAQFLDATERGTYRLFQVLDANGDGSISMSELRKGLHKHCGFTTKLRRSEGNYEEENMRIEKLITELYETLLSLGPEPNATANGKAGEISHTAFAFVIRMLKLGVVCAEGLKSRIHVFNYTDDEFEWKVYGDGGGGGSTLVAPSSSPGHDPLNPNENPDFAISPQQTLFPLKKYEVGDIVEFLFHLHSDDGIEVSHKQMHSLDSATENADADDDKQPLSPQGYQKQMVHWVHCNEPSKRLILALGQKYALLPQFQCDLLNLWQERAKVDTPEQSHARLHAVNSGAVNSGADSLTDPNVLVSTAWTLIVVPAVRLSHSAKRSIRAWEKWRRRQFLYGPGSLESNFHLASMRKNPPPELDVEVLQCNVAFLVSDASDEIVLTVSSDLVTLARCSTAQLEQTLEEDPPKAHGGCCTKARRCCCCCCRRCKKRKKLQSFDMRDSDENGYTQIDATDPTKEDLEIFDSVLKVLRLEYSHLRTGDRLDLVFRMILDLTEELHEISKAYDAVATMLQNRLDAEREHFSPLDSNRLQRMQRQLANLYRVFRQVDNVVCEHFRQDALFTEDRSIQPYLADIVGNVRQFLESVVSCQDRCKSLEAEWQQYLDRRMSNILYVLTLVTTIFVPVQCLTGLYGMNFDVEFDSNMPELSWQYGYVYFWALVVALTSLLLILFKQKRWL